MGASMKRNNHKDRFVKNDDCLRPRAIINDDIVPCVIAPDPEYDVYLKNVGARRVTEQTLNPGQICVIPCWYILLSPIGVCKSGKENDISLIVGYSIAAVRDLQKKIKNGTSKKQAFTQPLEQ